MLDASPGTTFTISLNGESHTLWYGLRAWMSLGVNPLKPSEIQTHSETLDPTGVAKFVQAGMLWRYRQGEELEGQQPPDIDFLIDHLDVPKFLTMLDKSTEAAGLKPKDEPKEPTAEEVADPLAA